MKPLSIPTFDTCSFEILKLNMLPSSLQGKEIFHLKKTDLAKLEPHISNKKKVVFRDAASVKNEFMTLPSWASRSEFAAEKLAPFHKRMPVKLG